MAENPADRRRFPRYDVAKLSAIKGQLQVGRSRTRLVMLGRGGCGFFSDVSEPVLKNREEVICTITFDHVLKQPLVLKGKILYGQVIKIDRGQEMFYGVEFLPGQETSLMPVISKLEELSSQGKIKVCS